MGAGAKRPKNFFRTQVRNCFAPTLFAPTPLFAFLSSWTNFKKFLTPSTPTPLFAFLPFWTNFNFAQKTHESGTEVAMCCLHAVLAQPLLALLVSAMGALLSG